MTDSSYGGNFPFKWSKDNNCPCCYILAAGVVSSFDRTILREIDKSKGDRLIVADAGILTALEEHIDPDIIIGDFDSGKICRDDSRLKKYESIIETFPVEKDDTDLMLCVKRGLDLSYKKFLLFGALGGEVHHTLATYSTLALISGVGGIGAAIGDNLLVSIFCDETIEFESKALEHNDSNGPKNGKFSLFPFGNKSICVSIKGAKYEVNRAYIDYKTSIGAGNSRNPSENLKITAHEGNVLFVMDRKIL